MGFALIAESLICTKDKHCVESCASSGEDLACTECFENALRRSAMREIGMEVIKDGLISGW